MQPHDPLWLVAVEPVSQEVAEQLVVAEPLLVEPAQEQVAFLDLLERRLAVRHAGQLDARSPEIRSAVIEVASRKSSIDGFQRVEHVLGEEFADCVVSASIVPISRTRIVAAAKR